MKPRPLAVAWLIASVLVLVWWLYTYARGDLSDGLKAESQMYVILAMGLLSFPTGLLWAVAFSLVLGLLDQLSIFRPLLLESGLMWAGFVVVGYLQWFVFGPWMLARFRAWRSPSARNTHSDTTTTQ